MKLSALISDGMVLQRETENKIWGYAKENVTVRLQLNDQQVFTESGEDGYFELKLPPLMAGGPYTMRLTDGNEEICIEDVLVGDVFLLGGQSNMELPVARTTERYGKEIAQANEEQIRMFEVPKEYAFGEKRAELATGKWTRAKGEELLAFSAAGYFAAKEIRERENVPVGLLQTAVGGTPVKAWCKKETIQRLGYDVEDFAECEKDGYPEAVIAAEGAREANWWEKALEGFEEEKERQKGKLQIPGFFTGTELEKFRGSLRITKEITLPDGDIWKREGIKLYLGALQDADQVYVNGQKIGETAYRYPPRIYPVPAGLLKAGKNRIEIRMLIFCETGGFMPGKEYEIRYGEGTEEYVPLSGSWEYEIMQEMEPLPETTFFQYKASGLYQGMLFPIRKYKIRGCFFYQGESNTGRPETYEEEFTAMVEDWRELFENPELPFLYVQLAGFADGKLHTTGTNWAKLREAQHAAEKLPNTMMVQAYDLGEYNDLHPVDKKNVGKRIALAAERVIYGKKVSCCGPVLREICREGECIRLYFSTDGEKLCIRKQNGAWLEKSEWIEKGTVQGLEAVYEDGSVVPVQGSLEQGDGSGEVVVVLEQEQEMKAGKLRYAWNDCPLEANLYGTNKLPALPFSVKLK